MNRYQNVKVFPCALGNVDGEVGFELGPTNGTGRLVPTGPLKVRVHQADTLIAAGEIEAPDLIKIDVEGAEAEVLAGLAACLVQKRPTVFLATHNQFAHRACLELFAASGYRVQALDGGSPDAANEVIAVAGGEIGYQGATGC
jgi:hypothetical protein